MKEGEHRTSSVEIGSFVLAMTLMTSTENPIEKVAEAAFVYTGPGTLAGRYMRMFWQPIYIADRLKPGHALPIHVLGEKFTLYRGESGAPYVMDFRCAHRGTQLSVGWVEGECIRCFYHGWKYDGTGQCVEQPAEDVSFAAKVKIRSYPTQEYLGLIFTYLGEGAAPTFRRYSQLEQEGVLDVSSYVRNCNYFSTLENGVDQAHVPFTHAKSNFTKFGLNWDIPKISAQETEYGVAMYGTRSDGVSRVNHYVMPNILYIKGSPEESAEKWRDTFAWRVPIDDVSHASFNGTQGRRKVIHRCLSRIPRSICAPAKRKCSAGSELVGYFPLDHAGDGRDPVSKGSLGLHVSQRNYL